MILYLDLHILKLRSYMVHFVVQMVLVILVLGMVMVMTLLRLLQMMTVIRLIYTPGKRYYVLVVLVVLFVLIEVRMIIC
jgi:hypothetical protein